MDTEAELLESVCGRSDLVEGVMSKDVFDDWKLVKELGEFLIRIFPDMTMGHAFAARASRHLGDLNRARAELKECRRLDPRLAENAGFLSFVADEEQKLASRRCGAQEPGESG